VTAVRRARAAKHHARVHGIADVEGERGVLAQRPRQLLLTRAEIGRRAREIAHVVNGQVAGREPNPDRAAQAWKHDCSNAAAAENLRLQISVDVERSGAPASSSDGPGAPSDGSV
jgi:hypothetical protein